MILSLFYLKHCSPSQTVFNWIHIYFQKLLIFTVLLQRIKTLHIAKCLMNVPVLITLVLAFIKIVHWGH